MWYSFVTVLIRPFARLLFFGTALRTSPAFALGMNGMEVMKTNWVYLLRRDGLGRYGMA